KKLALAFEKLFSALPTMPAGAGSQPADDKRRLLTVPGDCPVVSRPGAQLAQRCPDCLFPVLLC
ncbi:MAG: hypothetical protein WA884_09165, partial [Methyloceanibacter sp.]